MKFLCKIVLLFIILWFVGLGVFNLYIRSYPVDKNTKTDAIVVLTGGANRIKEAFELLNNDLSDTLFISGVEKRTSLNSILKAQNVYPRANKKIILENASQNTVENAIEVNSWIKKNNIKSIRLVTSHYHLPRSALEFKIQNKGLNIVLSPVFSKNVASHWWASSGTFCLVASEYTKFLLVFLKMKIIDFVGVDA